jgi:hypothetical protein
MNDETPIVPISFHEMITGLLQGKKYVRQKWIEKKLSWTMQLNEKNIYITLKKEDIESNDWLEKKENTK